MLANTRSMENEMKYLTVFALLLIVVMPAHAYLDGGSGSYIVQMAMAGMLALAFSVKLAWQRIKSSISRFGSHHRGQ